jgi:hypothetical protein
MSIRNTRPDPRRVRRQRPIRSARNNAKLSNDSVPGVLRFLTHRYVFIGFVSSLPAGIILGVLGGILTSGSGTPGSRADAATGADVRGDDTGATVTPAPSAASLTPPR